jgi:hypothetical protein
VGRQHGRARAQRAQPFNIGLLIDRQLVSGWPPAIETSALTLCVADPAVRDNLAGIGGETFFGGARGDLEVRSLGRPERVWSRG